MNGIPNKKGSDESGTKERISAPEMEAPMIHKDTTDLHAELMKAVNGELDCMLLIVWASKIAMMVRNNCSVLNSY
jgi:hypothetical protein